MSDNDQLFPIARVKLHRRVISDEPDAVRREEMALSG